MKSDTFLLPLSHMKPPIKNAILFYPAFSRHKTSGHFLEIRHYFVFQVLILSGSITILATNFWREMPKTEAGEQPKASFFRKMSKTEGKLRSNTPRQLLL